MRRLPLFICCIVLFGCASFPSLPTPEEVARSKEVKALSLEDLMGKRCRFVDILEIPGRDAQKYSIEAWGARDGADTIIALGSRMRGSFGGEALVGVYALYSCDCASLKH